MRYALAVGLVALAAITSTTASARAAAPGSSCAHPAIATFRPGEPNKPYVGPTHTSIEIESYRPWWVEWSVPAGYVVCQARIELRNGSWVGPTQLQPYATPTPTGGEYREGHHAHSPLRLVVVTVARSPVKAGSSCNYPLSSALTLGGPAGDTKAFSVNILEPGFNGNGSGLETTFKLQLEVTVHNPRIVICAARLSVIPRNTAGFFAYNQYKEYTVAMPPGGGLSPTVIGPVNSNDGTTAVAYGRYG
jgi:hypothetical protein